MKGFSRLALGAGFRLLEREEAFLRCGEEAIVDLEPRFRMFSK